MARHKYPCLSATLVFFSYIMSHLFSINELLFQIRLFNPVKSDIFHSSTQMLKKVCSPTGTEFFHRPEEQKTMGLLWRERKIDWLTDTERNRDFWWLFWKGRIVSFPKLSNMCFPSFWCVFWNCFFPSPYHKLQPYIRVQAWWAMHSSHYGHIVWYWGLILAF